MPFAVKQQAGTRSSDDLPQSRTVGQSAWPSRLYYKMSSAHNLPGMSATPHFIKKIGELGLIVAMISSPILLVTMKNVNHPRACYP
jgi:hypothetical protein